MNPEQDLEKAGADLRNASSAMPFPQMRVRKPTRQRFVAFAAGLAAALIIGVPFYLTRTSPPGVGQLGAAAVTTTTEAPDTTTSMPPATSTTQAAPPTCGSKLPYQVTLPADFTGPFEGTSPHAPASADHGQLVMHWVGRDGSVEIRWPANQEYLRDAVWGELQDDGIRKSESVMFIGPALPAVDGVEGPAVFAVLPTEEMSGPCDAAQLAIYRPGKDGGDTDHVSATFGPGGPKELVVYPGLARPRDMVLIVETIETDTIPEVLACDGGPGADFVPRKSGTPTDSPSFGTPEDALRDLLGTEVAGTWPNVGYFELVSPDGTVTYANPYDDNSPDPRPDNGLVISITVVEVEDGWTVTEWETSGC